MYIYTVLPVPTCATCTVSYIYIGKVVVYLFYLFSLSCIGEQYRGRPLPPFIRFGQFFLHGTPGPLPPSPLPMPLP